MAASWVEALLAREHLPSTYRRVIDQLWRPISTRIIQQARARRETLYVQLCGAQGSGKTTAGLVLAELFREAGLTPAVLSIDDFYLTRAQRQALAQEIHPLLMTRGAPGTHDVSLARECIAALRAGQRPRLPRFDKGQDDRYPLDQWWQPSEPVQVVLLEGWCVGARPESEASLRLPINELESSEDPAGQWRQYVNAALAGAYRPLFEGADALILLKAPSFEVVYGWRLQQEHKLRARLERECSDVSRVMDDAAVARFIQHYERVTRHILEEMPARATELIVLDEDRDVISTD